MAIESRVRRCLARLVGFVEWIRSGSSRRRKPVIAVVGSQSE